MIHVKTELQAKQCAEWYTIVPLLSRDELTCHITFAGITTNASQPSFWHEALTLVVVLLYEQKSPFNWLTQFYC